MAEGDDDVLSGQRHPTTRRMVAWRGRAGNGWRMYGRGRGMFGSCLAGPSRKPNAKKRGVNPWAMGTLALVICTKTIQEQRRSPSCVVSPRHRVRPPPDVLLDSSHGDRHTKIRESEEQRGWMKDTKAHTRSVSDSLSLRTIPARLRA